MTIECDGERLAVVRCKAVTSAIAESVIILHGAGTARKERTLSLADDLAQAGLDVISFDFSGHGDSSGSLRQLSLARRCKQTRAVIDELVEADHHLTLIGFSMSGQTVGDLLGAYGNRVTRIALCSPAIYAKAVWTTPFSDAFTRAIRVNGSWRDSDALGQFARFSGRAVLAVPGEDTVIPSEVTFEIEQALNERSDFVGLVFGQATHQLGTWFEAHADSRQNLVKALLIP
jgi:hypothetical protein